MFVFLLNQGGMYEQHYGPEYYDCRHGNIKCLYDSCTSVRFIICEDSVKLNVVQNLVVKYVCGIVSKMIFKCSGEMKVAIDFNWKVSDFGWIRC